VNDKWPANVTETIEIGSQRGARYDSFSDLINAFLKEGWQILSTYVEGKGPESTCEECICLLGWSDAYRPRYPSGYER
jgi:hypothetical protein